MSLITTKKRNFFLQSLFKDLDKDYIDNKIAALLQKKINGWESLVAGKARASKKWGDDVCRADTHGGFDNDPFTLNSVLFRILGKRPEREFGIRDLQW